MRNKIASNVLWKRKMTVPTQQRRKEAKQDEENDSDSIGEEPSDVIQNGVFVIAGFHCIRLV